MSKTVYTDSNHPNETCYIIMECKYILSLLKSHVSYDKTTYYNSTLNATNCNTWLKTYSSDLKFTRIKILLKAMFSLILSYATYKSYPVKLNKHKL